MVTAPDAATVYDAIIVGSGITGGWAAKELTQKGLRVLVLERGRMVRHVTGYTGEHTKPWNFRYGGKPDRALDESDYPIQSTTYNFDETTRQFFINDRLNPYSHAEGRPFVWVRGDQVGGRSLTWGRQTYRWSDLDFEANARDGHGVDWPIRYAESSPGMTMSSGPWVSAGRRRGLFICRMAYSRSRWNGTRSKRRSARGCTRGCPNCA